MIAEARSRHGRLVIDRAQAGNRTPFEVRDLKVVVDVDHESAEVTWLPFFIPHDAAKRADPLVRL